MLMNLDLILAI